MEELLCLNVGNSPFGLSCNALTFWIGFSPLRAVQRGMLSLYVEGSKSCDTVIRAGQELVRLHVIMEQDGACSAEKAVPKTTILLVSHGFRAFDIALAISCKGLPSAIGLDAQF